MLRTQALLLPCRRLRRLSCSILLLALAAGTGPLNPTAVLAEERGAPAPAVPATLEQRNQLYEKSRDLYATDQLEEAAAILEQPETKIIESLEKVRKKKKVKEAA